MDAMQEEIIKLKGYRIGIKGLKKGTVITMFNPLYMPNAVKSVKIVSITDGIAQVTIGGNAFANVDLNIEYWVKQGSKF